MLCPKCKSKSTVSQVRDNGRRRRNCTNHLCQHVFHTEEFVVPAHEHGGDRRSGDRRKQQVPV